MSNVLSSPRCKLKMQVSKTPTKKKSGGHTTYSPTYNEKIVLCFCCSCSPQQSRRMKSRNMKMQVRHKKARLHFMCNLHTIWTRRAKLAPLGLKLKPLARRRSNRARCATCIFNLQRGPLATLQRVIYSEIDFCKMC